METAIQLLIGLWLVVAVAAVLTPSSWLAPLKQGLAPSAEIRAARAAKRPPWMVAVEFVIDKFRIVVATLMAVVVLCVCLYVLATRESETEWATHGLAASTTFLMGEGVGYVGAKK